MKVKLKTSCYIVGYGSARIDEVIEIDSKMGESLVGSRIAVLVEETPIKKETKKEVAKKVVETISEENEPKVKTTRKRKTSEK